MVRACYRDGMRRGLLAIALLLGGGAAAKKPAKPKPTQEAAIRQVLDQQVDAVTRCAVGGAAADGKLAFEIAAKLMINHAAQVLVCDVTVEGGAAGGRESVRACVERVLRAAPFPKGPAPLVTIERRWRISSD